MLIFKLKKVISGSIYRLLYLFINFRSFSENNRESVN